MLWLFWPKGMWDLRSLTRDWTHIPCIGRWNVNHWTTRKSPYIYIYILITWVLVIYFYGQEESKYDQPWSTSWEKVDEGEKIFLWDHKWEKKLNIKNGKTSIMECFSWFWCLFISSLLSFILWRSFYKHRSDIYPFLELKAASLLSSTLLCSTQEMLTDQGYFCISKFSMVIFTYTPKKDA